MSSYSNKYQSKAVYIRSSVPISSHTAKTVHIRPGRFSNYNQLSKFGSNSNREESFAYYLYNYVFQDHPDDTNTVFYDSNLRKYRTRSSLRTYSNKEVHKNYYNLGNYKPSKKDSYYSASSSVMAKESAFSQNRLINTLDLKIKENTENRYANQGLYMNNMNEKNTEEREEIFRQLQKENDELFTSSNYSNSKRQAQDKDINLNEKKETSNFVQYKQNTQIRPTKNSNQKKDNLKHNVTSPFHKNNQNTQKNPTKNINLSPNKETNSVKEDKSPTKKSPSKKTNKRIEDIQNILPTQNNEDINKNNFSQNGNEKQNLGISTDNKLTKFSNQSVPQSLQNNPYQKEMEPKNQKNMNYNEDLNRLSNISVVKKHEEKTLILVPGQTLEPKNKSETLENPIEETIQNPDGTTTSVIKQTKIITTTENVPIEKNKITSIEGAPELPMIKQYITYEYKTVTAIKDDKKEGNTKLENKETPKKNIQQELDQYGNQPYGQQGFDQYGKGYGRQGLSQSGKRKKVPHGYNQYGDEVYGQQGYEQYESKVYGQPGYEQYGSEGYGQPGYDQQGLSQSGKKVNTSQGYGEQGLNQSGKKTNDLQGYSQYGNNDYANQGLSQSGKKINIPQGYNQYENKVSGNKANIQKGNQYGNEGFSNPEFNKIGTKDMQENKNKGNTFTGTPGNKLNNNLKDNKHKKEKNIKGKAGSYGNQSDRGKYNNENSKENKQNNFSSGILPKEFKTEKELDKFLDEINQKGEKATPEEKQKLLKYFGDLFNNISKEGKNSEDNLQKLSELISNMNEKDKNEILSKLRKDFPKNGELFKKLENLVKKVKSSKNQSKEKGKLGEFKLFRSEKKEVKNKSNEFLKKSVGFGENDFAKGVSKQGMGTDFKDLVSSEIVEVKDVNPLKFDGLFLDINKYNNEHREKNPFDGPSPYIKFYKVRKIKIKNKITNMASGEVNENEKIQIEDENEIK